jgi:uncharacterized protein YqeY
MLDDRIHKDYIAAMKGRDRLKAATLNFLRAQMKNVLIEKRRDQLSDQDIITVIKKQIKQRQDSIAQYAQGGRQDLVEKETAEMAVLKEYLPEEMSEQELEGLVTEAIAQTQANSMKDMGQVMKVMTEKVQGRADNKLISELVKRALS